MAKSYNVTIIDPEKVIYEGKAVSMVVPCQLGYLGILAGHAPLIANVVSGKITLRKESNDSQVFDFKGKGFLEILNNNVTLLLNNA